MEFDEGALFLDIATTIGEAEIIHLSILNGCSDTLCDEWFKPVKGRVVNYYELNDIITSPYVTFMASNIKDELSKIQEILDRGRYLVMFDSIRKMALLKKAGFSFETMENNSGMLLDPQKDEAVINARKEGLLFPQETNLKTASSRYPGCFYDASNSMNGSFCLLRLSKIIYNDMELIKCVRNLNSGELIFKH